AIDDPDWLRGLLRQLSDRHEAREAKPWRMADLPAPYLDTMLKGIVGLELAVTRLEGKFKLSQNRPAADRPRIVAALEARGDAVSRGVARLMRERAGEPPSSAAPASASAQASTASASRRENPAR